MIVLCGQLLPLALQALQVHQRCLPPMAVATEGFEVDRLHLPSTP